MRRRHLDAPSRFWAYRAVLNVTERRYVAPKLLLPKPVSARRALAWDHRRNASIWGGCGSDT